MRLETARLSKFVFALALIPVFYLVSGCAPEKVAQVEERSLSLVPDATTKPSGGEVVLVAVDPGGELVMRWGADLVRGKPGQVIAVDKQRAVRVVSTDPVAQSAKIELYIYKETRRVLF